jgi:hypothetical protein
MTIEQRFEAWLPKLKVQGKRELAAATKELCESGKIEPFLKNGILAFRSTEFRRTGVAAAEDTR